MKQTFTVRFTKGVVAGKIISKREDLRNLAFNLLAMGGKVQIGRAEASKKAA
jgi:hypothetical protein